MEALVASREQIRMIDKALLITRFGELSAQWNSCVPML